MTFSIDALKGDARTVVTHDCGSSTLHLVTYLDGSWGIVRDRSCVSVWEPQDQADCFRAFAELTGTPLPPAPPLSTIPAA